MLNRVRPGRARSSLACQTVRMGTIKWNWDETREGNREERTKRGKEEKRGDGEVTARMGRTANKVIDGRILQIAREIKIVGQKKAGPRDAVEDRQELSRRKRENWEPKKLINMKSLKKEKKMARVNIRSTWNHTMMRKYGCSSQKDRHAQLPNTKKRSEKEKKQEGKQQKKQMERQGNGKWEMHVSLGRPQPRPAQLLSAQL